MKPSAEEIRDTWVSIETIVVTEIYLVYHLRETR
jgi:hypothetical protein